MAVLNTTSPMARPGAPVEMPRKTVPSSSTRIADSVKGIAYVGLQKAADASGLGSGQEGIRRARMIPARATPRQRELRLRAARAGGASPVAGPPAAAPRAAHRGRTRRGFRPG